MFISTAAAQTTSADRTYEGKWYISDDTDNNTGERKVYAFQVHLKQGDPNYVTLTMRCSKGKPTFFVDWQDVNFPDQVVLTIAPVTNSDSGTGEDRYIFEKSDDVLEDGLRASPEASAKIVSALGHAQYATVTAHLSSGAKSVEMEVDGTQGAWNRVFRHCPIQIMPKPPL